MWKKRVSPEAVRGLYRSILGREAESKAVVKGYSSRGSVEAVAQDLLDSDEYLHRAREIIPPADLYKIYTCYDFELFIPEKDWMFEEIKQLKVYEPHVIKWFREACRDARVVDVGANVGVFSIVAAQVTSKKVTAVELSSMNTKYLTMNMAHNGIDNVEILPVGATDQVRILTSVSEFSNKVVSGEGVKRDNFLNGEVALGVPLDMVIHDKIDVLKMDIEGHEYFALQGCTAILDGKPDVFLEFSPLYISGGSGVSADVLLQILYAHNYQVYVLHRDGERELVGQDTERLIGVWQDYMGKGVNHIDIMLKAA